MKRTRIADRGGRNGQRQIGQLTKKQLASRIGQNILGQLSDFASGIRMILDKGIDPGTKQPLRCSPEEIKSSLTPEQLTAVEDFYTTFAVSEEREQPGSQEATKRK